MRQPPLLPEETLTRVYRLARVDGTGVLAVAGFFACVSAAGGDFLGAIVGLLVAGAGAIELHGAALLRQGEERGITWLVGSQFFLLTTILSYCGMRLLYLEIPPIPDELRPMIEMSAAQAGLGVTEYLKLVYRLGLWMVALVSLLYQGGMMLYYLRRRDAISRALHEE
ncbi:MAG: hypothetical protein Q7S40_25070 [Opitutaceae bacterium]|nr:hypothetical protein [Opitutaceae bacterium]